MQHQYETLLTKRCCTAEQELDARMLAHVFLDQYLTGSPLQGDLLKRTTAYIIKMLMYLQDPRPEVSVLLQHLNSLHDNLIAVDEVTQTLKNELASTYCSDFSFARNFLKKLTLEDFDDVCRKAISPLACTLFERAEQYQTIVLPGGWAGVGGEHGHAMCYVLSKSQDGSYEFSVINTGDGSNYHLKISDIANKSSVITSYQIPANVSAIQLINFIVELLLPRVSPKFDDLPSYVFEQPNSKVRFDRQKWSSKLTYSGDRLYKEVIYNVYLLGATPINPTRNDLFTQGQLAGTCSMQVLMAFCRMSLNEKTFDTIFYQINLCSILDYYAIHPSLDSPQVRSLLSKAIGRMARMTQHFLASHDESIVPTESAARILATLANIKDEMNRLENRGPPQQAVILNANAVSQPDLHRVECRSDLTSESITQTSISSSVETAIDYRDLFSAFRSIIDQYNPRIPYNNLTTLQRIETAILALPLDTIDDYLQSMDEEQARHALVTLLAFSNLYYTAALAESEAYVARQMIGAYTLRLVSVCLFNKIFPAPAFSHQINYIEPLPEDVYIVTFDTRYDKHVKSLQALYQSMQEKSKASSTNWKAAHDDFDENMILSKEHESVIAEYADTLQGLTPPAYKLRHALYHLCALTAKPISKERAKVKETYLHFLQYLEINDICSRFKEPKSQIKRSREIFETMKCERKTLEGNKHVYFFSNLFIHQYNLTRDVFALANPEIKKLIFCKTNQSSNQLMLEVTPEYRAVSFTRHLNDALRIFLTDDFFTVNLDLLHNRDYQTLFMVNIFTPGLLLEAIDKNPVIVARFIQLIHAGIHYYSDGHHIEDTGGVFFFEFAYFLLKYLEEYDVSDPYVLDAITSLSALLNDRLPQFIQVATDPHFSDALMAVYFLNGSLQSGKIRPDLLEKLYKVLLQNALENAPVVNPIVMNEIAQRAPLTARKMQRALISSGEDVTTILANAISGVLTTVVTAPFSVADCQLTEHKISVTPEGTFQPFCIDALTGHITYSALSVGYIPSRYLKPFKKFFDDHSIVATIVKSEEHVFYQFMFNQHHYEIIVPNNPDSSIVLKTKPGLEKNWYVYVFSTLMSVNLERLSNTVVDKSCAWGLCSDQETGPTYYYTDYAGNSIMNINKAAGEADRYVFLELTPAGEETGYTLVANPLLRIPFPLFDTDGNIEVWQHVDSTSDILMKIDLPRYHLHWDGYQRADLTIEFIWRERPEYRLFLTSRDVITNFSHCIAMEHRQSGEKICLIPQQEFILDSIDKDNEYYKLNYDIASQVASEEFKLNEIYGVDFSSNEQAYCCYTISGDELVGQNQVDCLQLAYIYLALHQPDEAMQSLRHCVRLGGIQGTEQEIELIRKIMEEIPNKTVPRNPSVNAWFNNPETAAVRVFAAFLLADQTLRSFGRSQIASLYSDSAASLDKCLLRANACRRRTGDFYSHFQNKAWVAYNAYYDRIANIPIYLQLSVEHEELLSQMIFRSKPSKDIVAIHRTRELKYKRLKAERRCLEQKQVLSSFDKTRLEHITRQLERDKTPQLAQSWQLVPQVVHYMPTNDLPPFNLFTSRFQHRMNAYFPAREDKEIVEDIKHILSTDVRVSLSSEFIAMATLFLYAVTYPEENWVYGYQQSLDFIGDSNKSLCSTLTHTNPITLNTWVVHEESIPTERSAIQQQLISFENNALLLTADKPTHEEFIPLHASPSPAVICPTILHYDENDPFMYSRQHLFEQDLERGASFNEVRRLQAQYYVEQLSEEKLKSLKHTIGEKNVRLSEELAALELQILAQANYKLQVGKSLDTHAKLLGSQARLMTMMDLLELFIHGDAQLFSDAMQLDFAESQALYQQLYTFLLKATEHQQQQRILKKIEEVLSDQRGALSPQYKTNQIAVGDLLEAKREYAPAEHPEFLVFEYLDNKLLRPDQCSVLAVLTHHEEGCYSNHAIQLIMGSGKSKVLLPILALSKANGTNLSMIIVPESLFKTNVTDLTQTIFKYRGKSGYGFVFKRDTDCAYLKATYKRLKHIIRNRNFVITTSASIQSLQLKYEELLKSYAAGDKKPDEIRYLEKILKLIKERGDALIDEGDIVLSPTNELNYTTGVREDINGETFDTILKLYYLSETDKTHDHPRAWVSQLIDPAWGLDEKQTQAFIDYVLDDALMEMPHVVEMHPELQNTFALMKGIFKLLQTTQKGKYNVNYGFPRSEAFPGPRDIAIPYLANNTPNEVAQFGSVYEIILYTIQAHQQQAFIPLSWIEKLHADFFARAKKEQNATVGKKFSDTEAAIAFKVLTDGVDLASCQTNNPAGLRELQKKLSPSQRVRAYVLRHYILPNIKQYPVVLRSNAINHVEQYHSVQVFSGTFYNHACFNPKIQFDVEKQLGTDGRTIDLLLKKDPSIRACSLEDTATLIKTLMSETCALEDRLRVHAFIDIGAFLKGDNQQIARLIALELASRPGNMIQHVLYFNENNQLCAIALDKLDTPILIGSTDIKEIEAKTGSSPAACFTLYDHYHITGVDIVQVPDAVAVCTVHHDTKARDVWQGVSRLRALSANQQVIFALSKTAEEKARLLDENPQRQPLTIEDVVRLVQQNQDELLARQHLISSIDNIQNVLRQDLFERLLSCEDVAEKARLYSCFSSFFEVSLKLEPKEEFGPLTTLQETNDLLTHKIERYVSMWRAALSAADINIKPYDETKIMSAISPIKDRALSICRPAYYQEQGSIGRMIEVEREKEKEKEKEKEREKEKEKESWQFQQGKTPIPPKVWGDRLPEIATDKDLSHEGGISLSRLNTLYVHDVRFSPTIFVSENYKDTFASSHWIFHIDNKPTNVCLLRVDTITKELKALLITQEEALEFELYLKTHKTELQAAGEEAWLVTPSHSVIQGTSREITHPAYPYLSEQLQFINGEVCLLSQRHLDWLLDDTEKKMELLNRILVDARQDQKKYTASLDKTIKIERADSQLSISHLLEDTGLSLHAPMNHILEKMGDLRFSAQQAVSFKLVSNAIRASDAALLQRLFSDQNVSFYYTQEAVFEHLTSILASGNLALFDVWSQDERVPCWSHLVTDDRKQWFDLLEFALHHRDNPVCMAWLLKVNKYSNFEQLIRVYIEQQTDLLTDWDETILTFFQENIYDQSFSIYLDCLLRKSTDRERVVSLFQKWIDHKPYPGFILNKALWAQFYQGAGLALLCDATCTYAEDDHTNWIQVFSSIPRAYWSRVIQYIAHFSEQNIIKIIFNQRVLNQLIATPIEREWLQEFCTSFNQSLKKIRKEDEQLCLKWRQITRAWSETPDYKTSILPLFNFLEPTDELFKLLLEPIFSTDTLLSFIHGKVLDEESKRIIIDKVYGNLDVNGLLMLQQANIDLNEAYREQFFKKVVANLDINCLRVLQQANLLPENVSEVLKSMVPQLQDKKNQKHRDFYKQLLLGSVNPSSPLAGRPALYPKDPAVLNAALNAYILFNDVDVVQYLVNKLSQTHCEDIFKGWEFKYNVFERVEMTKVFLHALGDPLYSEYQDRAMHENLAIQNDSVMTLKALSMMNSPVDQNEAFVRACIENNAKQLLEQCMLKRVVMTDQNVWIDLFTQYVDTDRAFLLRVMTKQAISFPIHDPKYIALFNKMINTGDLDFIDRVITKIYGNMGRLVSSLSGDFFTEGFLQQPENLASLDLLISTFEEAKTVLQDTLRRYNRDNRYETLLTKAINRHNLECVRRLLALDIETVNDVLTPSMIEPSLTGDDDFSMAGLEYYTEHNVLSWYTGSDENVLSDEDDIFLRHPTEAIEPQHQVDHALDEEDGIFSFSTAVRTPQRPVDAREEFINNLSAWRHGMPHLMRAVVNEDLEMVKLLLEYHPDLSLSYQDATSSFNGAITVMDIIDSWDAAGSTSDTSTIKAQIFQAIMDYQSISIRPIL